MRVPFRGPRRVARTRGATSAKRPRTAGSSRPSTPAGACWSGAADAFWPTPAHASWPGAVSPGPRLRPGPRPWCGAALCGLVLPGVSLPGRVCPVSPGGVRLVRPARPTSPCPVRSGRRLCPGPRPQCGPAGLPCPARRGPARMPRSASPGPARFGPAVPGLALARCGPCLRCGPDVRFGLRAAFEGGPDRGHRTRPEPRPRCPRRPRSARPHAPGGGSQDPSLSPWAEPSSPLAPVRPGTAVGQDARRRRRLVASWSTSVVLQNAKRTKGAPASRWS